MVYDLNVPWTPTTTPASLTRTITFLTTLGYTTLALTHTLNANSLPSQITNPLPSLPAPPKTTILSRCTLLLSDPAQNPRLSALASTYSILAVRPTTEKAFLAACTSLPEFSLISLDLTQRFPFHFKPKPLMAAIHRGLRFEICYGQAIGGDSGSRRNFISNVMGIVRATKGRGLVISGECKGSVGVRGAPDVLNLLGVWGLGRERGLEALGVNARGVVVNEGIKRSGFRGVVDVVYGGEKVGGGVIEEKVVGGKKGKGKRRVEDTNADGLPQISKRQAKRLKLEALKAGKEVSQETPPTKDTLIPEISDVPSKKAKSNG